MTKGRLLLLLSAVAALLLAACAAGPNTAEDTPNEDGKVAGFCKGLWHGIIAPIALWVRLTVVALLLQFPLILKFIDIPFKKIFRVVSFAHISYIVLSILKTSWLLRLTPSQISEEALTFTPFAITNFLNASSYPNGVYGILSQFNIFEGIWCLIVVNGLASTGKIKKIDATLLVLVIWTLLLVFQWALVMYLIQVNS